MTQTEIEALDNRIMPCGPYKGRRMGEVPAKHLLELPEPPAEVAEYIEKMHRYLKMEEG